MAKKSKPIVLLDSGIVFRVFRGEENLMQELEYIGFENLAVSIITVAEMYKGMRKEEYRKTKELLNLLKTYHINKEISKKFFEVLTDYHNTIEIPDAFIASTALVYNIELYTLNKKDFDYIDGLKLYKPKF